MCDHAVEGAPVLLVGVETLVEEFAQEAAVLRGAEGISVARRDRPGLLMLHGRRHVAQRRKAEPGNHGALGLVAQLIDMAGLIAALEIERGDVGHHLPVLDAAELPLRRAGSVRGAPRKPSRTVSVLAALAGSTGG